MSDFFGSGRLIKFERLRQPSAAHGIGRTSHAVRKIAQPGAASHQEQEMKPHWPRLPVSQQTVLPRAVHSQSIRVKRSISSEKVSSSAIRP